MIMFETIYIAIALIGSLIAGIWDLKTTNIPDSLIYGMIGSGIILHAVESFYVGSFDPLFYSLLVGGAFFAFSAVMYFTGQWGGGDGGILTAIGFLVPVYSGITAFPFPITYFVNMLLVGAVFSIIYIVAMSFNNKKIREEFYKQMKTQKVILTSCSLAFVTLITFFSQLRILSIAFFLTTLLYIFYKYAKIVETRFYRKIPVSKLQIDDMIGQDIPKLKIYKKYIRGLTKKEVDRIKKYKKTVLIREGIRYSIVFPIALLVSLYLGDVVIYIIELI